ncbi:hypothetical protein DY218_28070 [Streptomyces triticagri]|uniref:Flp pilus assembly protein RcpC/CpaB domain-containing protein n=1 Tax=Streptomyces triticagri TaxID=2293568 RepID=A0A372LYN9_9ACTN|nr:hypothetical protein [Streptomyces triticagri]RFU83373.1 hypothetical protein DY218_28070 [Streptomyces triticagri]
MSGFADGQSSVPPPCEVPHFSPLRVRGSRLRLHGALRRGRRVPAACLAMAAAALAAAGAGASGVGGAGAQERDAESGSEQSPATSRPPAGRTALVTAPVRIADAETVRLLRPGDRVDVIAADPDEASARVVAAGVRVQHVPEGAGDAADATLRDGALVVLSVPRTTAVRLAGAAANARLAVTVC